MLVIPYFVPNLACIIEKRSYDLLIIMDIKVEVDAINGSFMEYKYKINGEGS